MNRTFVMLGMVGAAFAAGASADGTFPTTPVPFEESLAKQRPNLSFYGAPGIIDMPTALMSPDADVSLTTSTFGGITRNTLTFQIMPRLSGSFRYAATEDFNPQGAGGPSTLFDRSFDLRYQLLTEGERRPAVTVGLIDFAGTGLLGSEFVVATKTFDDGLLPGRVTLSGGIGWGRFGTFNGFTNPLGALDDAFETRPTGGIGQGGEPEFDRLFRGDAALFAGLTWQIDDRWTVMAEYSSDAYVEEVSRGLINRDSPLNFGASYRFRNGLDLGLYFLHGETIGLKGSFNFNPRSAPSVAGIEAGPPPVFPRPLPSEEPLEWRTDWPADPKISPLIAERLTERLAEEGLVLQSYAPSASRVMVRIRNTRFAQSAQALGRAARILSRTVPASVETFDIVLVEQGIDTTVTRISRTDLEELEFAPDNAWKSYVRAETLDAAAAGLGRGNEMGAQQRFRWRIGPYLNPSFFDPNRPILIDIGLSATASFEPAPGTIISGELVQPLITNRDDTDRVSNSVLPKVRSEMDNYFRGNDPRLSYLTLEHFFRPGENIYGRFTLGYLETAFAGVSGEILWKKPGRRDAYGVEINAVQQRAPGSIFDLGSGDFDTSVVTGHASLYYQFDNGFHGRVDVGRYLAGDWGATFALDREFANGWSVGAFATFTDVSFDDFGEGSFDKGLVLKIPLDWSSGRSTRERNTTTLRPILRDGGARLDVRNRLYDLVREDSDPDLAEGWGRFWR